MKLFCVALLACQVSLFAQSGIPNQPYIYVEGKAEIDKPADMVTFRFEVSSTNINSAAANKEAQAKATSVFELLSKSKIANKDIIASDFRSEPEYERTKEDPNGEQGKIIGYRVSRPFVVRVADIKAFPQLIDELLGVNGLDFSGIQAGLSNTKEVEDEIWNKAIADGRSRADKTARAMGMKLESAFAISPVSFPRIAETIFDSKSPVLELHRDLVSPGPNRYLLPPITVSQSVHIIYLISPAK
jgi:uncharacterized protein